MGMYVIVVGAGKVGWNLARELLDKGHEVTLIENNRERYATVEQELEHNIQYGDASELWVLERAGISRADMVIAVTGDDEDNVLICQVAKEKYLCERTIARVNNPRNKQWFELLGVKPVVSATDLILRLIEHEVPEYGLVHLLDLPEQRLEIIEMLLPEDSKANGVRVGDLEMPDGSLLISVLREGRGFVPGPDTVLESGDEILAVLDPTVEEDLTSYFGPDGSVRERRVSGRSVDFLIVGGGLAAAYCASELRGKGAEGSILLAGREPEPPYERPPLSKEYLRGEAEREDAYVHPRELVRGERRRATERHERDGARPRGAHGEAADEGGGGVRQGADRDGRQREHPPGRGRRAGGDPLPAGVRQLGRDPRGGRGGRARGADRRQLHRLRGGGVADGEGDELHDRDDGGRGAVADVRRGAGSVVPRAAGVEGRRDLRRRGAGAVRGRRPGAGGRHEGRADGRGRHGRRRRRGEARRDDRRACRARGGRRDRLRREARDVGARGSSPPATSARGRA